MKLKNYKELKLYLYISNPFYRKLKNNSMKNLHNDNFTGGSKGKKKISVIFNEEKYTFERAEDNVYILYSKDEHDCVTVIIDPETKIVTMSVINSDVTLQCTNSKITNQGSFLLKLTIKTFSNFKEQLNINLIELTDNSALYCTDINETIKLADLSFLQYNSTWYGWFGFYPKNEQDNSSYEHNKKILSKLKTHNIKLDKIINNYKKQLNDELKKDMIKYYEKYNNKLFINWFYKISKLYLKNNCHFFNYFMNYIYLEYKLKSFYGSSFIRKL